MQWIGYSLYFVFLWLAVLVLQGQPIYFAAFMGAVVSKQLHVMLYLHKLNQRLRSAALPPALKPLPMRTLSAFITELKERLSDDTTLLSNMGYWLNSSRINNYWEVNEGVDGTESGTLTYDATYINDSMKISNYYNSFSNPLLMQSSIAS